MVPNIYGTTGHKIKNNNHPIIGTQCVICIVTKKM